MRSLDELHALPNAGLVTPPEAAAILVIEARLLAEWRVQRNGPPFIKVGHLVRYRMGDLRAWLEARSRKVVRRGA